MPRTFGGVIQYAAPGIVIPTASVGTTAGLYSILIDANGIPYWGQTAGGAGTVNFIPDNSNLARPYITFPAFPGQGSSTTGVIQNSNEFLETFGTSAGAPGNPFSGVAAGNPAVAGALPGTIFGTPNVPWGLSLIDVFAVYSVQTAALTSATLGVQRVIFTEATAESVTTVLAPTAVALTTTASATTVHVQRVSLAQPLVFEAVDYSDLNITFAVGAAATSVVRVYALGMHVAVCYA